jgi:hypothetical protein
MGFADGGPVDSYALLQPKDPQNGQTGDNNLQGSPSPIANQVSFAEGGAIPESTTDVNTADDKQGSEAANPDLADAPDDNDPGNGGDPLLGVKQSLTYARQKAGLNDDIFKQLASNSGPIQPSPATGGKPPQGTLPPPPFNPRDWVPGGKKSSDKGDTMNAKKGGAIPEGYDAGGAVGEGGDPVLSDPNGSSAMGAALADGGNGIDSTLNPDEVPNTPVDPSTKAVQKKLESESKSDSQEPDNY